MKDENKIVKFTFLAIFFLFAIITTVHSFRFPAKARFLPVATGIAISGIIAMIIAAEFSKRLSKIVGSYSGFLSRMGQPDNGTKEGKSKMPLWRNVFFYWLSMLFFFLLIYTVGFFVATPIFVLFMLRVLARIRWLHSLTGTIFIWLFLYFVAAVLDMSLFSGIFFGEIVPPL